MAYNNPFVSMTYIKGFLGLTIVDLKERLLKIVTEDIEYDQIVYLYTKTLLDYHLYFEQPKEIREYLLYSSARWASKKEARGKRPLGFEEDIDNKHDKYFTKLSKSLINALIVKHDLSGQDILSSSPTAIRYNMELNLYMGFMYEISCIKRDRNC